MRWRPLFLPSKITEGFQSNLYSCMIPLCMASPILQNRRRYKAFTEYSTFSSLGVSWNEEHAVVPKLAGSIYPSFVVFCDICVHLAGQGFSYCTHWRLFQQT